MNENLGKYLSNSSSNFVLKIEQPELYSES